MLKFFRVCLLFVLFFAGSNSLFALDQADQNAIEKVIKGYIDAWNNHAGKGFGDGFAEDADFVNIFGMHFSGRAEIEDRHVKILNGFLKNSVIKVIGMKFREVKPDVVLAFVHWSLDGYLGPQADLNKPGNIREGIFTQVFLLTDNKWEITASQNTLMPQS